METAAPSYRPPLPTTEALLASLARAVGRDRAVSLFRGAAARCHVRADSAALNVRDLRAIARELAGADGAVSMVGLGLRIRCDTYLALAGEDSP